MYFAIIIIITLSSLLTGFAYLSTREHKIDLRESFQRQKAIEESIYE